MREILNDIVADDRRAGEVIRRLRALLKRGEVQHAPLDMRTVVDDVLRLTRNDLMHRDVLASAELAPDLPAVLGDRIQLQQVLLNLVINACEAMVDVPGLGLSICRTIVTAHGGRLWAENDGVGATFRFTIPPGGHAQ